MVNTDQTEQDCPGPSTWKKPRTTKLSKQNRNFSTYQTDRPNLHAIQDLQEPFKQNLQHRSQTKDDELTGDDLKGSAASRDLVGASSSTADSLQSGSSSSSPPASADLNAGREG
jgi:hypothetical protein